MKRVAAARLQGMDLRNWAQVAYCAHRDDPTIQHFLARHESISTPLENAFSGNILPRATLVAEHSPCIYHRKALSHR